MQIAWWSRPFSRLFSPRPLIFFFNNPSGRAWSQGSFSLTSTSPKRISAKTLRRVDQMRLFDGVFVQGWWICWISSKSQTQFSLSYTMSPGQWAPKRQRTNMLEAVWDSVYQKNWVHYKRTAMWLNSCASCADLNYGELLLWHRKAESNTTRRVWNGKWILAFRLQSQPMNLPPGSPAIFGEDQISGSRLESCSFRSANLFKNFPRYSLGPVSLNFSSSVEDHCWWAEIFPYRYSKYENFKAN